jgi:hypothetical protein
MEVCKRRDHVIVFRVTDEERTQLQKAFESSGSRNLSEFVRMELLNRVQSRMAARTNLATLEKRLSDLEANYLQAVKGPGTIAEENGTEARQG